MSIRSVLAFILSFSLSFYHEWLNVIIIHVEWLNVIILHVGVVILITVKLINMTVKIAVLNKQNFDR